MKSAVSAASLWHPGASGRLATLMFGAALAVCLAMGCATKKAAAPASGTALSQSQGTSNETGQPTLSASVEIQYAHKNDLLKSFVVTQFTGATVLFSRRLDAEHTAAVARFDGGVPIWRFHSTRGVLHPLSVFESSPYHVTKVQYGKVPSGFSQDIPDVGPPPPLELGGYYVFAIERSSGVFSYQAMKVEADGSLEVYDAEPRAGTSYRLCCNLDPDFASSSTSFPDLTPQP